ncbi:hypothetical protein E2F47_25075 [Mycobacterium eburneum]|nr:hypothetical protein [Mycobacterium eburneum]TDH48140.1 hypothetical protein E2F47_25075 [Mycobacterium eburneum]
MGAGLGGMPFMPMGAGAGAGSSKPKASPDNRRFVPPHRANSQKVIGESNSDRLDSKRSRREQRMNEAKNAATEQREASDK